MKKKKGCKSFYDRIGFVYRQLANQAKLVRKSLRVNEMTGGTTT